MSTLGPDVRDVPNSHENRCAFAPREGGSSRSEDTLGDSNHEGSNSDGQEAASPEVDRGERSPCAFKSQKMIRFGNTEVTITGNAIPEPIFRFESSGLIPILLRNIRSSGFRKPMPLQKCSIPAILKGRDLISCSPRGSGKTAAYMIPILEWLLTNNDPPFVDHMCAHPEAVILSASKELSVGVGAQSDILIRNSNVRMAVVYENTLVYYQRSQISAGYHVLAVTPTKLKEFLKGGYVCLSRVKYIVLDHADRLLGTDIFRDVNDIFGDITMPPIGKRQTLMFSTTFPRNVQLRSEKFVHNHIFLSVQMSINVDQDVRRNLDTNNFLINKQILDGSEISSRQVFTDEFYDRDPREECGQEADVDLATNWEQHLFVIIICTLACILLVYICG